MHTTETGWLLLDLVYLNTRERRELDWPLVARAEDWRLNG